MGCTVASAIILPIILIVVVALLILLVFAGGKIETDEEGKVLIKNIFVYLVLFATLMMVIGGSVAAFMAVADIVSPVPYHQTFEEYSQFYYRGKIENPEAVEKIELSEAELEKKYDSLVSSERDRQIARAKNSLIKSFGWIIIPLPVFIVFQRRLRSQSK